MATSLGFDQYIIIIGQSLVAILYNQSWATPN